MLDNTKKREINFTQSKVLDTLDNLIDYDNIYITTDYLDSLVGKMEEYINNLNLKYDDCSKLSDDLQNIATEYSRYSYKEGFKEGVRLMKTLFSF